MSTFFLKIILYPLSLLPLQLLYILFAPIKWFLQYILQYRKKIILKNLQIAFPDHSEKFAKKVKAAFYSNIYMLFCESIKSLTISEKKLKNRMYITNPEVVCKKFEVKNVLAVLGHYNNWEWTALACPQQLNHTIIALYQQLNYPATDKWVNQNRSRYGAVLVSTKNIKTFSSKLYEPVIYAFISDQSPSKNGKGIWVDFFGKETFFLAGPAVYAQKQNTPFLFADIQRKSRGRYTLTFEILSEDPSKESVEELIQKMAKRMEKQIRDNPYSWLWSHNRWKYSKNKVQ